MYRLLLILAFLLPSAAMAVDAPAQQEKIGANQVLRGAFTESHPVAGFNQPMESVGRFVLTPSQGLLWIIQKPMATTTIVTRQASVQDIGGLTVKLPIRNLQYLYDIVTNALAGNWDPLTKDFTIQQSVGGSSGQWLMLLRAKPGIAKTPYQTISVTGGRYIESIILTTADNSDITITFSDVEAAHLPLTANEAAEFRIATNVR